MRVYANCGVCGGRTYFHGDPEDTLERFEDGPIRMVCNSCRSPFLMAKRNLTAEPEDSQVVYFVTVAGFMLAIGLELSLLAGLFGEGVVCYPFLLAFFMGLLCGWYLQRRDKRLVEEFNARVHR